MFEFLEDAWDYILDGVDYLIHFEWISGIGEFLGSMFEGIGEFSVFGLVFGILTLLLIIIIGKWTIAPFAIHYKPLGQLIIYILTYVGCFAGGYLVGKHFEND
jgi:hypothetical protein